MSTSFSKPVMPRLTNPLLADAATIERFIAHCHRRKYPARTDVFRPGDAAGTLYYIMSGSVSIIASEEDGRELVLGYIGPGEFVGEMGLFVESDRRGVALRTRTACDQCVGRVALRQEHHHFRAITQLQYRHLALDRLLWKQAPIAVTVHAIQRLRW